MSAPSITAALTYIETAWASGAPHTGTLVVSNSSGAPINITAITTQDSTCPLPPGVASLSQKFPLAVPANGSVSLTWKDVLQNGQSTPIPQSFALAVFTSDGAVATTNTWNVLVWPEQLMGPRNVSTARTDDFKTLPSLVPILFSVP